MDFGKWIEEAASQAKERYDLFQDSHLHEREFAERKARHKALDHALQAFKRYKPSVYLVLTNGTVMGAFSSLKNAQDYARHESNWAIQQWPLDQWDQNNNPCECGDCQA